ncbi:hypothetical protein [Cellulomonas endophytica]|uniref:hypothetical protein n=1 Tax=Cellulomonas endophytica TaxID=2494735 RepID=UPI001011A743|nr:hypothetical protein [Cellulomonas endophytica]
MSDAAQDAGPGTTGEGGYGYPSLEQEVTPEVLEAGAESDGSDDSTPEVEPAEDGGGVPEPGELDDDPSAVPPPD